MAAAVPVARLEVRLLGQVEARVDGAAMAVRGRMQKGVLAVLALACALPFVDSDTQTSIIDILLEHGREDGLAALAECFHLFNESNQTRVVSQTARLFGALRLTVKNPSMQTRQNSLQIIRRSENPRLAYLAAACVHDGSTHIRADSTSLTEIASTSLFVRFNNPASTPPGPNSMKKSHPSATRRSMQSSQRTVPVTWS
jgi:hypothetical protein